MIFSGHECHCGGSCGPCASHAMRGYGGEPSGVGFALGTFIGLGLLVYVMFGGKR